MTWDRFTGALVAATMAALIAYTWLPILCGSLARPILQMRRDEDGDRSVLYPPALIVSIFALVVCHLAGAFLFAMTGGALGVLSQPENSDGIPLHFAVSAGILTVAMVRIEATRQTLDLLNTFQQLLVGWSGAFVFCWLALPNGGTVVADRMRALLAHDLPIKASIASLAVVLLVESSIHFGVRCRFLRQTPYDLVRQRLDGISTAEQVWHAPEVETWTVERVNAAFRGSARLDAFQIAWLTNTHPPVVLDRIEELLRKRWDAENPGSGVAAFESWLRSSSCKIRVLVPSTRESELRRQVANSVMRYCIKIVQTDESPSTRFMVLNNSEALIHMALNIQDHVHNSSNVGVRILDASKIALLKGSFDVMWSYSRRF